MVDSHAARLETSPLNHMRGRAKLHTDEAGVEYVPKSLTRVLEFDKVFSRLAPLEIDLGCGDGAFLAVLAQENPAHNFLGIERLLGRVRSVCRKVARLDLKNARILRMESNYAVTHLLPPAPLRRFTCYSPIRGQNGDIIGDVLSPPNLYPPFIAPSLPEAYFTLPLITRITFTRSKE